jgi:indole-3-glycerol phosphate synthase
MTVLEDIVAKTRAELQLRKDRIPAKEFDLDGETRSLSKAIKSRKKAVITEIKPGSPSEGQIRNVDAALVAREMEAGGAAALSVLTEPFYFSGSVENLKKAKDATSLPVMRKDFVIDDYQLREAKHYGADAVLLMVSVLKNDTGDFYDRVKELGMEAIVEAHDKEELDTALDSGAEIIGINNRNLSDLTVDLATTQKLSQRVPDEKIIVSESGVKTKEDLEYVLQYADAALVGTSLMRSDNIKKAVEDLLK